MSSYSIRIGLAASGQCGTSITRVRLSKRCPLSRCSFVVKDQRVRKDPTGGDIVQYALLIYEKPGAYEPFSDEERRAISAEYLVIGKDPRVVGGAKLKPVETATTVRCRTGRRSSPTARSRTRKRSSAAITCSRPLISMRRSKLRHGSRPRASAARSRYGRWCSGRVDRTGLPR